MLIELERKDDVCIIRLRGRFAAGADSAYLRGKAEEVKAGGAQKVLADFTEVPYLDSVGIGFLIGIYTNVLKSSAGRFAIVRPNERVRAVLQLTKLTGVFPAFEDETLALRTLQAGVAPAEKATQA
jgi:anti-anti-sigma factor